MNARVAAGTVFLGALAFSIFTHFTFLDWGLPGEVRTLQVMGTRENMQKWVPVMVEQRNKYYGMVNQLLDDKSDFRKSYDQLNRRWETPLFEPIPQDMVLDRMRNYLVGVNVSDEQYTLSALSGINPKKMQFAPGLQAYYGGFYYYSAAASLLIAKIAGKISLTSNAEYYFYHPEETRSMYIFIRALGGLSVLATLAVLFVFIIKFYGPLEAALSVLFFASFPLLVPITHLTKAHTFGMFWLGSGMVLCGAYLRNPDDKNAAKFFYASALCLGLSAGTVITNLAAGSILFFAEAIRLKWNLKKISASRFFWTASAVFLAAFSVTNFYIFTRFAQFQRLIQAMKEYFPAFTSLQLSEWGPYLREFCTEQIHWGVLPLVFIGVWSGLKRRDIFVQLSFFALVVLFLQNLITTRHYPVNARILPLLAFFAAVGVSNLLNSASAFRRILILVYTAAVLSSSALQTDLYRKLHRSSSNIDQAGLWINQNVGPKESLGAWGKGFAPFDFPAVRFLDHSIIAIPHLHELDSSQPDPKKMPDILVLVSPYGEELETLSRSKFVTEHYETAASWSSPESFSGLKFKSSLVKAGNWPVYILRKKQKSFAQKSVEGLFFKFSKTVSSERLAYAFARSKRAPHSGERVFENLKNNSSTDFFYKEPLNV